MKTVMVRYRVKQNKVRENEQLIREVYRQLQEEKLSGVHYSTHKLEDGLSFVQLATFESTETNEGFKRLNGFQKFSVRN